MDRTGGQPVYQTEKFDNRLGNRKVSIVYLMQQKFQGTNGWHLLSGIYS